MITPRTARDDAVGSTGGTTSVVDLTSEQLILNTTDATPVGNPAASSARMRAFEDAARVYLQHSPSEWTVQRVDARRWNVVDHRGETIARRTTMTGAGAAIEDGPERRIWNENRAWYRGESTDPRVRQLTTEEQAIVARILAEIDSVDRPENE